jgi:omega-amidase
MTNTVCAFDHFKEGVQRGNNKRGVGMRTLALLPQRLYPLTVNVVALQFDPAWEDKPANFAKVRGLLTATRPQPGSLVALPEMFATGFSMNATRIAELPGGPTWQFVSDIAREFQVCLVAGAAICGANGQAWNKALVFAPDGKFLACYAKMRLFSPGKEADHFLAGERPVVFSWDGCPVAPFICYDLRFPELFRAAAVQHRPELFIVIANWPEKRAQHWVRLLQARAVENQAFVLAVNRIGSDPYYTYAGRSLVIDPHGEILADAESAETCLSASLDLSVLRKYREGLPFLDDLRL